VQDYVDPRSDQVDVPGLGNDIDTKRWVLGKKD
jgi:hypothetical protein